MTFREEMARDIDDTFLNEDDFGEKHTVEGKEIVCMFDDDELTERQGTNELAVSDSSLLLFAKSSDLPPKKPMGDRLEVDGKIYVIDSWTENIGMSTVVLHHGESYGG